ncbi:UDP-N-acetylmuramoyl-L-alanine--D-glutamate ligase [soil metagenome]
MNNANNKQSPSLCVIIGLGLTGLACARFFMKQGIAIAITDSRNNPPGLDKLTAEFPNIPLFLGKFEESLLANATELIVSPGVSPSEPIVVLAKQRGIPIIGDIEIFARYATAPICAITGSNAKSTVTSLVTEMARTAGLEVRMGGNIGVPALDLLADAEPQLYVLELSSFQLETTFSLKPAVATILNITPDHMDRYASFLEYKQAKHRIYQCAQAIVWNRDDENTYPQTSIHDEEYALAMTYSSFGLSPATAGEFGLLDTPTGPYLTLGTDLLISVNEITLKGRHNWANALAALALGHIMQLSMPAMLNTLKTFKGLPHRCQLVIVKNGVSWYNDSKGTNVGATVAAIEGLGQAIRGKLILIAGGVGKGADFTDLRQPVARYVRSVILIGEAAQQLQQTLSVDSKILRATDLEEAIRLASQEALSEDAVLLSPACASFDMFNNFEHRGLVFMETVKEMLK